jgi:hypothetical protein
VVVAADAQSHAVAATMTISMRLSYDMLGRRYDLRCAVMPDDVSDINQQMMIDGWQKTDGYGK